MKKTTLFAAFLFLLAGCTPNLTQEKFNAVKTGMSVADVEHTVDPEYWNARCIQDDDEDPDLVKAHQLRYVCTGEGLRTHTVSFTFEKGRLVRKFSNGRLNYTNYD